MKYFCLILSVVLCYLNTNAQCMVDAGAEIHMCLDQSGLDSINLSPVVTNATYPLQSVTWKYFYQVPNSSITETAASFLNDTSVLNPYFTMRPYLNDIVINLSIVDSAGNICTDSLEVSYSHFNFFPDDFVRIHRGDTAHIYAIAKSGFPPYTYSWTPNYNISSDTLGSILVWPEHNQQYQATVVDSFGCSIVLPAWTVEISLSSIKNFTSNELSFFPNPTNGRINFIFEKQVAAYITLSNALGQVVLFQKTIQDQLDLGHLPKGKYFFKVNSSKEILSTGSILLK